MGIRDKLRQIQAQQAESREALRTATEERFAREAEVREAAEAQAAANRAREVFGPELAEMNVETAEDAKAAIRLAKLQKREFQAEKKEIASGVADAREAWRMRQAGRIQGVGRGFVGDAVRAKRRSERQGHAANINAFSDMRQEVDSRIALLDRFVLEMERQAASLPSPKKPTSAGPSKSDPLDVLSKLAAMRDQGLITAEEYEAKKADILSRL